LWIQAVSVGEVHLAGTLVEALSAATSAPIVISSTTPAGRAAAVSLASRAVRVQGVFHFPIDWPPFVRRTLDAVRPSALLCLETEIWPGLLRECGRRGVKVAILNGRISPRSSARYRRFGGLFRGALATVGLACMQSEDDARRAREIGVPEDSVVVTGSMKFDAAAGAAPPPEGLVPSGVRHVLVAGSTSPGEEEIVLDAFEALSKSGRHATNGLYLILAPRHRERFDEVDRLLARRGLAHARRSSEGTAPSPSGPVLLLDTIGELAAVYGLATAAFIGGSLVPRGGQNPIEAAARGVPVALGPHTENFSSVAEAMVAAGAAFRVRDAATLAEVWGRLLSDDALRRRAGQAGRALVETHRGATGRMLRRLIPFLDAGR